MLRDITIGQYYPTPSLIHRLDPRVKIIGTLVYIVSLFLFDSFYGFGITILFLTGVIILSRVPFRYILRGLKPILFLLFLTMVFNFFLIPGHVIVHFWIFRITEEGLYRGLFVGFRLILLILGSSMMTFTTTPDGMNPSGIFIAATYSPEASVSPALTVPSTVAVLRNRRERTTFWPV